jgi:uncharacterized protein (UPF0276 family)
MGAGGPPHHLLHRIRQDYALSIHGVGLSIGGAGPLDRDHLGRLKRLVDRYRPALFSEHLAWSTHEGVFLNDLLPLPYNAISLAHVCAHIDEVQSAIGMRMLLENPSTYLSFAESTIPEVDFLAELSRRTGCGLLLDINNVFVSATNHATSPQDYLQQFPLDRVREIHLGGHDEDADDSGARLLIDSHRTAVAAEVWKLYDDVLSRTGAIATLIEWDNDVPAWPVLCAEAAAARDILSGTARASAA